MENNVLTDETLEQHKRSIKLMGNMFTINVVADNGDFARRCIDKAIEEIQRIEKLLTTFNDDSQTNEINKLASIAAQICISIAFSLSPRKYLSGKFCLSCLNNSSICHRCL